MLNSALELADNYIVSKFVLIGGIRKISNAILHIVFYYFYWYIQILNCIDIKMQMINSLSFFDKL